MRTLIAIFLVAMATIATLTFFSGFGYATGGGTVDVELFPKTVTASSETGQAVAVWGDIENFNAQNTPLPKQTPPRGLETWLPTIVFFAVVGLVLIWVLSQMGFSFPSGSYDDGKPQPEPASKQERRYG